MNYGRILLFLVFTMVLSVLLGFNHDAYAATFTLSDQASCQAAPFSGTWAGSTCTVSGFTITSGNTAKINSGITLINTGTISLDGSSLISSLQNGGTINNSGIITNSGWIENYQSGTISNSGTINNRVIFLPFGIIHIGTIINSGIIQNNSGGIINNLIDILSADIENYNLIDNYGTINNFGIIQTYSGGALNNQCDSVYSGNSPTGTVNNIACVYTPNLDLDYPTYAVTENAYFTIIDVNANTNPNAIDTITGRITSTTDATGITFTMDETGLDTAIFQVPFSFVTSGFSNSATKTLRVTPGDTILAIYPAESLVVFSTISPLFTCPHIRVSEDWIISSSCTMSANSVVTENVIVQNNSVLTVPSGITLDIDFTSNHLLVKSGSGVLVKVGGKIS